MRKLFTAIAIAALIVVFSQPAHAQRGRLVASFTDEDVSKAIEKGVKYLWSLQMDDGSWGPMGRPINDRGQSSQSYTITGLTALACYALLECGADPKDPRMQKALEWLATAQEKYVELKDSLPETTDWRTYAVGLRCNVWMLANKSTNNKYKKNFETDVNWLLNGTNDGGYGYIVPSKDTVSRSRDAMDNSNSQYGVLGVWAGQRAGMEIPRDYWDKCMKFWLRRQNTDGGWAYYEAGDASYGNMAAAGVATMFVCVDALMADKFVKCNQPAEAASINKGLDWFDKNLARTLASPVRYEESAAYYYLYCIERVGLASGYKYFGKINWFKEGVKKILSEQEEGGFWRRGGYAFDGTRTGGINQTIDATSFALLFMIRGQRPVIFNKLEYKGDWNNRPRDCANLTRWMAKAMEKDFNWQIITLKSEVGEWHDAPIVYIGGSIKPEFSDEDVAKLRTYVQQGGTLFVMTQCGGAAFSTAMKNLYKKLFPKYELTAVGKDHPLNICQYILPGTPAFSILSNGIRPLVIHTDADLSVSWQTYAIATGRRNFEAAVNISMYVTTTTRL
ncbi:MAG: DUF4159 domain-containing protein [Planctomycetes bacterium]|nr:DUF4159 domain-containing protein [Planctomycetota bacterium]